METLAILCNTLGILTKSNVIICDKLSRIILKYNSFSIIDGFKLTDKNIVQIKQSLLVNNTVIFEKIYNYSILYLGINMIKNNLIFIIGPFLIDDPYYEKHQELYKLRKINHIEYEFYLRLKKTNTIAIDTLFTITYNFINSNLKKLKNAVIIKEIIDYRKSASKTINITTEEMELTNRRYYYENLKLKYIKLGDWKTAIKCQKSLMSLSELPQRLPNNIFRSIKNGLYISSGMTRKAIEEIGVPPTLIHNVSSKIFLWIERCSTIGELKLIEEKIIKEYSLLAFFYNSKYSKYSVKIKTALLYIEINKEQYISLMNVSKFVGLNPQYFSRLFKKELGTTFREYIKKIKIELAMHCLKNKKLKILEIAFKLDYSSIDSFSKAFKIYSGISPSKFRKNNRKSDNIL